MSKTLNFVCSHPDCIRWVQVIVPSSDELRPLVDNSLIWKTTHSLEMGYKANDAQTITCIRVDDDDVRSSVAGIATMKVTEQGKDGSPKGYPMVFFRHGVMCRHHEPVGLVGRLRRIFSRGATGR